jgi:hypothetical protein
MCDRLAGVLRSAEGPSQVVRVSARAIKKHFIAVGTPTPKTRSPPTLDCPLAKFL